MRRGAPMPAAGITYLCAAMTGVFTHPSRVMNVRSPRDEILRALPFPETASCSAC
jgi:hypothetical protein